MLPCKSRCGFCPRVYLVKYCVATSTLLQAHLVTCVDDYASLTRNFETNDKYMALAEISSCLSRSGAAESTQVLVRIIYLPEWPSGSGTPEVHCTTKPAIQVATDL